MAAKRRKGSTKSFNHGWTCVGDEEERRDVRKVFQKRRSLWEVGLALALCAG